MAGATCTPRLDLMESGDKRERVFDAFCFVGVEVLTNREPPRLHEREAAFVLAQLADGLAFLHGTLAWAQRLLQAWPSQEVRA